MKTKNNQKHFLSLLLFYIFFGISVIIFLILLSKEGINGKQAEVFFLKTNDLFADFWNTCHYIQDRDPYLTSPDRGYPPLAYLFMYPFSRIIYNAGTSYQLAWGAIYSCWCSMALFYACYKLYGDSSKWAFGAILPLFFSSIFLFSFERGNLIMLAAVFVTVYFKYYNSNSKILKHIAFIALACAASFKVYPAIFGLLLLYEKRFKDTFWLILYGVAAFILPFFFFKGGISNINPLLENVQLQTEAYRIGYSVFARFGLNYLGIPFGSIYTSDPTYIGYLLAVLSVIVACFHQKFWKKIMLLLCVCIMIPVNSALYTGLYLFPAIVLMLADKSFENGNLFYYLAVLFYLTPINLPFIGNQASNYALTLIWIALISEGMHRAFFTIRKRYGESRPSITMSGEDSKLA
jgi:hypothetical protein